MFNISQSGELSLRGKTASLGREKRTMAVSMPSQHQGLDSQRWEGEISYYFDGFKTLYFFFFFRGKGV